MVSLSNSGASLPALKLRAVRLVSFIVVQLPPMSAPKLQVYMTRIWSPLASVPSATVKLLKPRLVNQSFSVPIQPPP